MLIGLWQGAILTETIFNWPGLGRMLYRLCRPLIRQ
jgi:ABC-type dipeptide/oligopeptide/nickel transport system permease component